ncbi:MAG TPA: hypothetical protein EYG97_03350 [Arcobacter sp.]|nr:hypothetical protein [Arcobacter sp.]HIP56037.1 hypothetical protein [Arcobacter sp.]
MSSQGEPLDKWEELLEVQIKILKECQVSKSLNSCTPCEHLIECDTRKAYIKAVYESMNKGSGGGFEF